MDKVSAAAKFADAAVYFSGGGTVARQLTLAPDDIEELYAAAHECLMQGRGHRAATLFTELVWLDHWNMDHWLGLGLSSQALGDDRAAVKALARGVQIDAGRGQCDVRLLRAMVPSVERLGLPEQAAVLAQKAEMIEASVAGAPDMGESGDRCGSGKNGEFNQ